MSKIYFLDLSREGSSERSLSLQSLVVVLFLYFEEWILRSTDLPFQGIPFKQFHIMSLHTKGSPGVRLVCLCNSM